MVGIGGEAGTAWRRTPFEQFVAEDAPRLRRGLVARFGVESGSEAFAEVMAYAWEHRDRLETMTNPSGYLYRVGLSAARPHVRWRRRTVLIDFDRSDPVHDHDISLPRSLVCLSQRVSVVMVHGYGSTYQEVADLLGISVAAVTNHVHRGLRRLRELLEVE
jgi:DNA-directed RNA polymerase specialized sigma24 family protein